MPICWIEEFITDARTTTEQNQTRLRSSRPQVIAALLMLILGGKLTVQYLKRSAGRTVAGIPKLRSPALSRLTVTKRTISRPYGAKLTHEEVRNK